MHYILFIFLSMHEGVQLNTQEFNSKISCEHAASDIMKNYLHQEKPGYDLSAYCEPKG